MAESCMANVQSSYLISFGPKVVLDSSVSLTVIVIKFDLGNMFSIITVCSSVPTFVQKRTSILNCLVSVDI